LEVVGDELGSEFRSSINSYRNNENLKKFIKNLILIGFFRATPILKGVQIRALYLKIFLKNDFLG
jgi:hypothetical protein